MGALVTAGTALLLVLAPGPAQAAFPGENGSIVFDSFDGEVSQVYAVKPDGSRLRPLTVPAPGVSNYNPAIGPSGDRVAYTSHGTPGPTEIRLVNLDGTGDVQLTDGPNSSSMPSFSPDGEKIVFSKPGVGADAIATINVDGTGLTQLFGPAFALNPAFSPDGSKIAFFGPTGALWLMEADGSDPHQIAAGGLAGHGRPSFSPDGTRIAFGSMEAEVGQAVMGAGIHSIKPDGTDRRLEVPVSLPNQPSFPAYSPDGESLAYVNEFLEFPFPNTPPPKTIRILDLTSGTSVPVPTEQTNISQIDWGVFTSDPPSCETDPSLCPPPPECKTRFTKARFFVFKNRPAYRLVARYWSKEPGEVEISFFARNADGAKGRSMGSLTRAFPTEGRFRVRKTVGRQRIKQLRRSRHGFIADFRIKGALPEYCEMAGSLDLTDPRRVKNQFVWFTR